MMRGDAKNDKDPDKVLHDSGWERLIVKAPGEVKYAITGKESQVVTVQLEPGDSVQGEAGSMMYLTSGMKQTVSCDGCCSRCMSGENCWIMNFTNHASEAGYVALTSNFPTSKVVPVDLSSEHVGGVLICQQGSYMASHGDVQIGISCDCNFMRCCCGGMGLVRQKVHGSGTVFVASTGTIVQKVLQAGEVILVDTNCILAFAESCTLDLKRAAGMVGMMGGGEGIFNTTLTGPGLVIVQSMNPTVFKQALAAVKLYRR